MESSRKPQSSPGANSATQTCSPGRPPRKKVSISAACSATVPSGQSACLMRSHSPRSDGSAGRILRFGGGMLMRKFRARASGDEIGACWRRPARSEDVSEQPVEDDEYDDGAEATAAEAARAPASEAKRAQFSPCRGLPYKVSSKGGPPDSQNACPGRLAGPPQGP